MFEKFGINPPMSGFFEDHQSEIVNKLIPIRYQDFFDKLKLSDEEIKSLIEWVASRPDLSPEEIEDQIAFHKKLMENMNSNT